MNSQDAEIEPAIQDAAYAYLPDLLAELDETPPAAFVVLHRSPDGAYLNAYSWVWDNVIECHTAAAGVPFLGCADRDPTNFSQLTKPWIGCVWELPPLAHERSAWVKHMLAPDQGDLDAYLADYLKRRTGGTVTDFDFLVGSWDVHNRRLVERLAGSEEWDEFPATMRSVGAFDGKANFDETVFPTKGFSGLTLRVIDPTTSQWSLYWVSSCRGVPEPPVVGTFTDGRGEFFGDDTHDGRPIRVRFIWSEITGASARWEQAFSVDDERTWETNWIMEFTRQP